MAYCQAHPTERFWQALRNWSGAAFIIFEDGDGNGEDTFYWNAKRKLKE